MAVAFVLVPSAGWRVAILAAAAATDLLDGQLARRFGSSRLGAVLDPVADKLFMAAAFLVVAFSGALTWYELLGVLLRDLVASLAFVVMLVGDVASSAVPARAGGKAVTILQLLTLFAFLERSPMVHHLAWATGAVALYALSDYGLVAWRGQEKGDGPPAA